MEGSTLDGEKRIQLINALMRVGCNLTKSQLKAVFGFVLDGRQPDPELFPTLKKENIMKSYILLQDRFEHKAGTKVYDSRGSDYGCARDDEEISGLRHQSVTLKENGDYPFFTVPTAHLKPLD